MKRKNPNLNQLKADFWNAYNEQGVFWMEANDLLDLSDHYYSEGEAFEAELTLRHAERLFPTNADVLLTRAYRLKDKGQWQAAREIVGRIEDLDAQSRRLFDLEWALNNAEFAQAQAIFEKVIASATSGADKDELLLECAEIYLDYGEGEMAFNILCHISEDFHDQSYVQLLRAECTYRSQEYRTAGQILNAAIDNDPYNADLWLLLSEVQNKMSDFAAAQESVDYALAIQPSDDAERQKLYNLMDSPDWEKRLADVGHVPEGEYLYYLRLGEKYLEKDKYAEALPVLRKAFANCTFDNPDKLQIISYLALALAKTGETDAAYQLISLSAKANVPMAKVWRDIATLAETVGDESHTIRSMCAYFVELRDHTTPEEFAGTIEQSMERLSQTYTYQEMESLWEFYAKICRDLTGNCNAYLVEAGYLLHDLGICRYYLPRAQKYVPEFLAERLRKHFPDSPNPLLACMREIHKW
ncbi:MAG: hypothetical protein ACI353_02355 [Alloprevotella sp.]